MALLTREADAGMDTNTAIVGPQISGDLMAGEDLDPVAPCRIHTDGKVYMSNGTAADANAKVVGWTHKKFRAGQQVTLRGPGVRYGYGMGLTPGTDLYLGATAGRLDTAATTGGTKPIARVISATDILVIAYQ